MKNQNKANILFGNANCFTALSAFKVANYGIENCKLQIAGSCCDIDEDIFDQFWSDNSHEIFNLLVLPKQYSEEILYIEPYPVE